MIFKSRNERQPRLRDSRQAAERANQLQAGIAHAATALERRDAKLAGAALEAGQRLAEATVALATTLEKRSRDAKRPGGEDTRVAKEAEGLLARGLDVLHRLHFEIIRHDLQETPPESLPVEEASRATVEVGRMAERIAGLS